MTDSDYRNFLVDLRTAADPQYLAFIRRIIPNVDPAFGVRSPQMTKIAKNLLKTYDTESALERFYQAANFGNHHEELIVQGRVVGSIQYETADALIENIDRYLPRIRNWALCDSFVSNLRPQLAQFENECWQQIPAWLAHTNPWIIRFGAVLINSYFCQAEKIDAIFERVAPIQSDEYYVNMGLAWMLSTLYFADKTRVLQLLQDRIQNDWVYNKALQKIRESQKIDQTERDFMKTLKR